MSIEQTSRFDNVSTFFGGKVFGPGASGVIRQTSRFDNVNTIYGGKVFGPGASGVIRQTSLFDNIRLVYVPVGAYRLIAEGGAYTYSGSKVTFLRGGGVLPQWLPVDDNQGANWQNASDAQTPGWVLVNDNQPPV